MLQLIHNLLFFIDLLSYIILKHIKAILNVVLLLYYYIYYVKGGLAVLLILH